MQNKTHNYNTNEDNFIMWVVNYMLSATHLFIVIWVHGRIANLQNETKQHNIETKETFKKFTKRKCTKIKLESKRIE